MDALNSSHLKVDIELLMGSSCCSHKRYTMDIENIVNSLKKLDQSQDIVTGNAHVSS